MISIKSIIIGIAIFILTMFVVIYGIYTFYPQPEMGDFCADNLWEIDNEAVCVAEGGVWMDYGVVGGAKAVYEGEIPRTPGSCQAPQSCYDEFDKANEQWHKIVFFITLPLGIILLAVGVFVFGLETVGAGLAAGGVGIIIWGVGGYWRYSENLLKFLLSLVGLIAVIGLAYWFNKRKK